MIEVLLFTYWLIAIAVAWPLNAAMLFADFAADAPEAEKGHRHSAGLAVAVGALPAATWPAGIPLVFCLTGFAERGLRKPWGDGLK